MKYIWVLLFLVVAFIMIDPISVPKPIEQVKEVVKIIPEVVVEPKATPSPIPQPEPEIIKEETTVDEWWQKLSYSEPELIEEGWEKIKYDADDWTQEDINEFERLKKECAAQCSEKLLNPTAYYDFNGCFCILYNKTDERDYKFDVDDLK